MKRATFKFALQCNLSHAKEARIIISHLHSESCNCFWWTRRAKGSIPKNEQRTKDIETTSSTGISWMRPYTLHSHKVDNRCRGSWLTTQAIRPINPKNLYNWYITPRTECMTSYLHSHSQQIETFPYAFPWECCRLFCATIIHWPFEIAQWLTPTLLLAFWHRFALILIAFSSNFGWKINQFASS